MRAILPASLLLGTIFSVQASATPSLSDSSVKTVHEAISAAVHGDRDRALATLEGLRLNRGVTLGVIGSDRRSSAVRAAVQMWDDRMQGCPVHYADQAPDIAVKFVPEISAGGDVQGKVMCHRRVFWGTAGRGYEIQGEILIKTHIGDHVLTSKELSGVAAHEVGHLLGLDDDSALDHLMGPFVTGHPVTAPTPGEVDRVESFRAAVRRTELEVGGLATIADRGAGSRGHRLLKRKKKVQAPSR